MMVCWWIYPHTKSDSDSEPKIEQPINNYTQVELRSQTAGRVRVEPRGASELESERAT